MDPFACKQSTVAVRFCTPLYERTSLGFNGLLIDWAPPHMLWLNPPWNILPLVLDKMIASKAPGGFSYMFSYTQSGPCSHGSPKQKLAVSSPSRCQRLENVFGHTLQAQ